MKIFVNFLLELPTLFFATCIIFLVVVAFPFAALLDLFEWLHRKMIIVRRSKQFSLHASPLHKLVYNKLYRRNELSSK